VKSPDEFEALGVERSAIFTYGKTTRSLRGSKPFLAFRESAPFYRKFAVISALTAFAQNEQIADSRRITRFYCPKSSETDLARVRVTGFEKVGTAERPPTISDRPPA
jgi:hypothetical protein